MTSIAVVGLGAMGARMASRLVQAGYDVVVWNRSRTRVTPLMDAGARPAGSPAQAARQADAVIIMVADPQALRDVTEGPEGILAGIGSPATVIQMSTVGAEPVRRLASLLPEGVGLLDAPVLGSIGEADAGTLKIFIGGEEQLLDQWARALEVLGTPVHVGPVGAGTAAKLVANSTLFGMLGVLGEAVALARSQGLADEVTFEVLATTPLAAQAERRRSAISSGDYPTRFTLALARKDADLVLAERDDLRLAAAARTWLADAEEAGLGEADYSAVLEHITKNAG